MCKGELAKIILAIQDMPKPEQGVAMTANVRGLCVVALSKNLKLTTTLDRAITQNPCYVPFLFGR